MKEKINSSKRLVVKLTAPEQKALRDALSKSTCRYFSEYARKKLFDKPIKIFTRNQSLDDFMGEMILLRNELNAIGNDFNQLVKGLQTLQQTEQIRHWAGLNEITKELLQQKVEEIKLKISQINDLWLQS
jgi:MobC-like protein